MIIEPTKPIVKKVFSQDIRKDLHGHFLALAKEARYSLTQRHNYFMVAKVFEKKITLNSAVAKLKAQRNGIIKLLDETTLPGPMMETFEAQCASYAQFDAIARFLTVTYQEGRNAES